MQNFEDQLFEYDSYVLGNPNSESCGEIVSYIGCVIKIKFGKFPIDSFFPRIDWDFKTKILSLYYWNDDDSDCSEITDTPYKFKLEIGPVELC